MKLITAKELLIIRGKAIVGHATPAELMSVFEYLDYLENKLDDLDDEDSFGSEGWRHFFGLE